MSTGLTLALDGSTYAGSVAVLRDTTVIAERQLPDSVTPGRGGRDENFLPMVAATLEEAGVAVSELDRIVCGAGPGSFTSLRVAASIAKGIAVGAGCELYAVSSLMLIASGEPPGRYVVTLPAMRGEAFVAVFDTGDDHVVELRSPAIVAESEVPGIALEAGAKVSRALPRASAVARTLRQVIEAGPRDVNTWEPVYGRLAEAQVKWEAAHGRPLTGAG
ncbi:MAG: tRNA (adenosine(37)-N6)-threonylcarbamoyltransferase complex dimerization subunit type 1 TsaB [Gemmatimonadaceae bacterium]